MLSLKNLEVSLPCPQGEVLVPPSKSISHRAVICASLAQGKGTLQNVAFSDDISATVMGMRAFGANIKYLGNYMDDKANDISVEGIKPENMPESLVIDCKESGSTLRFLIPVALLFGKHVTFVGSARLFERPLDVYYDIFKKQGIRYKVGEDGSSLTVSGKLQADIFEVPGNVSSQFISGLLFVLPCLEGDSEIIISSPLESRPYIDLTIETLSKFGIKIKNQNYKRFSIKGRQIYKPTDYIVEGDFSQAAFWLAAGVLGGNVACLNLDINSKQPDKYIIDILKKMGAKPIIGSGFIRTASCRTVGSVIDASQCPDLVPIVAVLGALSSGTTQVVNAERLRLKESDRLKAMASELGQLGAKIEELPDGLVIEGKDMLEGGIVYSWNDHRIAMALAISSVRCKMPVIIKGSDAVNKSYPGFWKDFVKLGGQIDEFFFRS